MLSEAKHLYNALKHELGFFAMLRMTINRSPLNQEFENLENFNSLIIRIVEN